MGGDGLRAEGESLVLFGLCRERLEDRVFETALVSFCSARENHEGGEYDIMILAAVQADFLCPRRSTDRTLVVSGCMIWHIATRARRFFARTVPL